MGKPSKSTGALAGIVFGLCWDSAPANAAIIIARSACYADVNAAVDSSSSGDTVLVPAGTATWSSTLDLGSKPISLIGAGSGSTIITNTAGTVIKSHNTGDNFVRISGFRFNSADSAFGVLGFVGPSHKVRVDHCYFERGDNAVGANLTSRGSGPVWGVIDHCVFHNMVRPYFAMDLRVGDIAIGGPNGEHAAEYDGAVAWTEPILPGSDHMMYVEDNTMIWNTVGGPPPGGAQCALYGQYGGRCCFRYNT